MPVTETRDACRVLVVDDNLDNMESLAMLVGLLGHQVETARNGLQAIEAARRFKPHLVLLDIGLPKLDGYEVAGRLWAEGGGDKLVLVAVTGWARDEERERATKAGFDHYLTKPVDPSRIASLVTSVCERR